MHFFVAAFVVWILGLVFGSFANSLIHRLPRKLSIVRPGSFCPGCETPLTADEKIPVLSYLTLGGRCAHCGDRISPRYPLVELGNALGWLGIFLRFGFNFQAVTGCLLFTGLLVAAVIDLEKGLIPNGLTLGLALIGFAASLLPFGLDPLDSLFGILVGGGFLLLFALLGRLIFKREALGGGDLKLLAAVGAFVGWKLVLLAAFVGVVLGAIVGGVRWAVTGKRELPFGPFLAVGGMTAFLAGELILGWYLAL